jgi:HEAT repeats
MLRFRSCWAVVAVGCLLAAPPARAYVDMAPTLGRIVRESATITLLQVERFSRAKGAVILTKVRDLKGQTGADPVKHQLTRANESGIERAILEWAEPGRRCVVFATGKTAVVCLGESWYQAAAAEDGWWRIGPGRPDLPLAYYGTLSRLADAIPRMVAGKSAAITTLPHGAEQEGASFDLALNRASLPGLVKVQRVRASLGMPNMAMGLGSNPAYVRGLGRAGRDDLPALREKLRAADATVRAESAADIGFLGADGAGAAGDLSKLLHDEATLVRLAAASALLRIQPADAQALATLARGLDSREARTRRQAARAAGLAGPAALPLAGMLGALLNDSDTLVQRTALQALATLGPAAAAAREPVTALLAQRETAIDAADALGRMGPAARPSLKKLALLLSADAPAERWAAVRAMAQIGGGDAAPAVKFMIRELPRASEVDGYNMLIYLALLGPVAREAIPAVRSSRVKNPVLRQTTVWAIDPGEDLPWLGPMGNAPFVQYILGAYVHELGDHLQPVARSVAKKIMAGTAGNVPGWGYQLLARYAEDTLAVFAPALADKELAVRERAAVALGYMGRAARAAKPQVDQALKASPDEREQRLLQWCLRELE